MSPDAAGRKTAMSPDAAPGETRIRAWLARSSDCWSSGGHDRGRRVAHRRAARRRADRDPGRVGGLPRRGGCLRDRSEGGAARRACRACWSATARCTPTVAAAMAEGARRRLGATVGAATTGVAGPDPADGQPVGTVHIAVSAGGRHRPRAPWRCRATGTRSAWPPWSRSLGLLVGVLAGREHMITALRTAEHAAMPSPALSVRTGTVEVSAEGLEKGVRRWSCFVTCSVTRCGGCVSGRVAPSERCPPPRGCRSVTCPRSSAARRKPRPSCSPRSAARWARRCRRCSGRSPTTSPWRNCRASRSSPASGNCPAKSPGCPSPRPRRRSRHPWQVGGRYPVDVPPGQPEFEQVAHRISDIQDMVPV